MRTKSQIFPPQSVVSGGQLPLPEKLPSISIPGAAQSDSPDIRLVREGDVVQAIDVTCACGRSFRLVCQYE